MPLLGFGEEAEMKGKVFCKIDAEFGLVSMAETPKMQTDLVMPPKIHQTPQKNQLPSFFPAQT